MYEEAKERYLNLVADFSCYDLQQQEEEMTRSRRNMRAMSMGPSVQAEELLTSAELKSLKEKL